MHEMNLKNDVSVHGPRRESLRVNSSTNKHNCFTRVSSASLAWPPSTILRAISSIDVSGEPHVLLSALWMCRHVWSCFDCHNRARVGLGLPLFTLTIRDTSVSHRIPSVHWRAIWRLDCPPIHFMATVSQLGFYFRPGRIIAPFPCLRVDNPVLDVLELVVLVHRGEIFSPIPSIQCVDNGRQRRIRSPHICLDCIPLVPLHLTTEAPDLAV